MRCTWEYVPLNLVLRTYDPSITRDVSLKYCTKQQNHITIAVKYVIPHTCLYAKSDSYDNDVKKAVLLLVRYDHARKRDSVKYKKAIVESTR